MNYKHCLTVFALASVSFTSASRATLIWDEGFDYADGPLTSAVGSSWVAFSGGGSLPITVADGSVNVVQVASGTSGEDDRRPLDTTYSTGVLYMSAILSTTAVTTSSVGTYFLSFYNESSSGGGYAGRIIAAEGSSSSFFKLGLSNAGSTATTFSGDLSLNTTYTVVMRYDLDADTATMGVFAAGTFPTSDSDLTLTGGAAAAINLTSIAMRQGTSAGGGTQNIQNIAVGTTLADVAPVPEPATVALVGFGLGTVLLVIRRRRA